jgi:hypothetical protein
VLFILVVVLISSISSARCYTLEKSIFLKLEQTGNFHYVGFDYARNIYLYSRDFNKQKCEIKVFNKNGKHLKNIIIADSFCGQQELLFDVDRKGTFLLNGNNFMRIYNPAGTKYTEIKQTEKSNCKLVDGVIFRLSSGFQKGMAIKETRLSAIGKMKFDDKLEHIKITNVNKKIEINIPIIKGYSFIDLVGIDIKGNYYLSFQKSKKVRGDWSTESKMIRINSDLEKDAEIDGWFKYDPIDGTVLSYQFKDTGCIFDFWIDK